MFIILHKGGIDMKFKKIKYFWENDSGNKKINGIPLDETIEYYAFLQKCIENGQRQIIITTEIMEQVIKMSCLDNGYSVYKIEFSEDDIELDNEIANILKLMEKNPAYLSNLLEKIKFLSDNSSIDIRRVYIKGKYNVNGTPNFYLQSNGILGVNPEFLETVTQKIIDIIKGYLN